VGEAAFAEAADRDVPLLVALVTSWSDWCRQMDERTYAEPRIAANVNDDFVPVRVDADRHPRVRERYNMGGFPSTVFVTPEGNHIAGATFLEPEGFRQVLQRVRETWDEQGRTRARSPVAAGRRTTPRTGRRRDRAFARGTARRPVRHRARRLGTSEKFPLPGTVEFAR